MYNRKTGVKSDTIDDIFPILLATSVLVFVILLVLALRIYIRWTVKCVSDERIDGKTVIITGANTGVGRATALELASRGGRIVLACRNEKKGEAAARQIRSRTGNPNVFASRLDLASLSSIREFVHEFNNKETQLHILINNAAYMGPRASTEEGIERTFGVNYLGHFYLTYLLLDRLRHCSPSRVINVISDSYVNARLDVNDLSLVNNYDIYGAYGRSKLCMVILTLLLHRKYFHDAVVSLGVHPGPVQTDLMRNWPGMTGNLMRLIARVIFKSPSDGCQSIVYCAVTHKARELSGKMVTNCSCMTVQGHARDRDIHDRLWAISLELCKIDES